MSRPRRGRVALYSFQGFVLRHVCTAEAVALLDDPTSGFFRREDGFIMKRDFQSAREESPTCITVSDMKMNVGLNGEPMPEEKRRVGYIDPIEAAREKIAAWPEIGDVKREVAGTFCPLPPILEHKRKDGSIFRIRHTEIFSFS